MHERRTEAKPFENSLAALAQVAMHEAGADGYAFFRRILEPFTLVRQDACGSSIPEDALGVDSKPRDSDPFVVAYPLGTEEILAFVFNDQSRSREMRPQLDRIAAAIESVWKAAQNAERYLKLASRVAGLEADLMDSKISARARGLLANRTSNSIDAIARHVEGVLRQTPTRQTLEQISRELAEEVEERRLTGQAKTILQSLHGMSEEQAHSHLRSVSRKSRRKLKDVARELIETGVLT